MARDLWSKSGKHKLQDVRSVHSGVLTGSFLGGSTQRPNKFSELQMGLHANCLPTNYITNGFELPLKVEHT